MGAESYVRECFKPSTIYTNNRTQRTIMNYKKDYSGKSAERWLAERGWTGFLMTVPLGETKYTCASVSDILCIRSTASQLSKDPDCDRTFSVYTIMDEKVVRITATLKDG